MAFTVAGSQPGFVARDDECSEDPPDEDCALSGGVVWLRANYLVGFLSSPPGGTAYGHVALFYQPAGEGRSSYADSYKEAALTSFRHYTSDNQPTCSVRSLAYHIYNTCPYANPRGIVVTSDWSYTWVDSQTEGLVGNGIDVADSTFGLVMLLPAPY